MLPELNGTAGLERAGSHTVRPRIILRKPNHGFHHPAGKREVIRFLDSLGPIARYGLRSVELTRALVMTGRGSLVFGRYEAPGRILLFEQAELPWRSPGILNQADTKLFTASWPIQAHLKRRLNRPFSSVATQILLLQYRSARWGSSR